MDLGIWVLERVEAVGRLSFFIYLLAFFRLLLSILSVHQRVILSQVLGALLKSASTSTTLTFFESRTETGAVAQGKL
jgi:hypothetical protein